MMRHIEICGIVKAVYSGIFKHIQGYSAIFSHVKAYWGTLGHIGAYLGIIEAYWATLAHTTVPYSEPWHI